MSSNSNDIPEEFPENAAPVEGGDAAPSPRIQGDRLDPFAYENPSSYLSYLPMIFHDNDFLRRYLLIFETIWEPLEQRQDHIAMYFDPHTSPASFLPWLASWLGIELSSRLPEATRRALLAEGMALQRWRGTRYCLARVIEICAGVTPQIIEDPALPFVVRVIITAPTGTDVDRTLIEELIRAYKPAYLGYVLEIRQ